jgi:hypothetical protein
VFTAWYAWSPYIKSTHFVFKGLIDLYGRMGEIKQLCSFFSYSNFHALDIVIVIVIVLYPSLLIKFV